MVGGGLRDGFSKARQIWSDDGVLALAMAVARSLGSRLYAAPCRRAYERIVAIASSDLPTAEKFTRIYDRKLWLKVDPRINADKSLSGYGSTLESTKVLRHALKGFLSQIEARRFLDIPCGDFNWMRAVQFPPGMEYIGGDVVPSLIARLKATYERGDIASRRLFRVFDITKDEFDPADVWLCKDCVQHLSNQEIMAALRNFCNSSVEFALISNHSDVKENTDISTGHFRHVDLTLPPFNLPEPVLKLPDSPIDREPRYLGVWRRRDLIERRRDRPERFRVGCVKWSHPSDLPSLVAAQ
jgi:hypothetical protein